MFNFDIIRAVYGKELRELTQDTRTILIVFLIPLLLMPAISISTYSTNLETLQTKPAVAIIDSQCHSRSTEVIGESQCFDGQARESLMNSLKSAELEAVLDVENKRVYLANASLTSDATRQTIEQYYLRMSYSDTPELAVEDFNSEASILNVIGTSLANVLVMLIIVFSFIGALNFGMDVTTGEKERGSFKLYAEFKERICSIFAGKLLFTSLCSGITAMLGIAGIVISVVAIESLYGDSSAMTQAEFDKITAFFAYVKMLSVTDVLVAALYLIPAILVISSFVNLIGCFAKNMKEAKLFGVILILVIMALTKVDLGDGNFFFTAFVPILNVFAGVNNAMTLELDVAHLLVSIVVNISICFNNLFDIKKLIVKEIV